MDRKWVLLNSITPSIGEGVCQHKTAFNHNFLRDSTGYNDRSHAVPAPLGCLLKVIGAGTGVAHIEIENMVIYRSVLCLLVAGYLKIKLKTEQVASNECRLPRKHVFLQLSTKFGMSIPTTASQTFLIVPDSIKPGRACNSDIDRVLRIKIEIILWWFMLFTWIVECHISTHPYFCHVAFAINTCMRKTVPALFLLPLLRTWKWG